MTTTSGQFELDSPELLDEAFAAIEEDNLQYFKNLHPDQRLANLRRSGELLVLALERDRRPISMQLIEQEQVACDSTNDENSTCVMLAAKKNNTDCLEAILARQQVDVNALDSFSWTALMYACYYGHESATRMLLLAGAATNIYDNDHISALIWASGRGHTSCVIQLIQLGRAKVNEVDKFGSSPLIWACRKGYTDIATILLKAGANIDSIGMFGWSALLVSVLNGHLETLKLLLQFKPNVNTCDVNRYTPLIAASKEGKAEMVRLLLKARAFVNLSDAYGHSALIHATKGGHLEVLDLLLRNHADVDHCGVDRKSALFWAVDKGNLEIVERLLQARPNLELVSKDGETCLMRAVKMRKFGILRLLLGHQAKVGTTDRYGDTILHIAVKLQSATLAHLILSNPKNLHLLNRQNKAKQTPIVLDEANQTPVLANLVELHKTGSKISYKLTDKAFKASNPHLIDTMPSSINLSFQGVGGDSGDERQMSSGSLLGRLSLIFSRQNHTQLHVLA